MDFGITLQSLGIYFQLLLGQITDILLTPVGLNGSNLELLTRGSETVSRFAPVLDEMLNVSGVQSFALREALGALMNNTAGFFELFHDILFTGVEIMGYNVSLWTFADTFIQLFGFDPNSISLLVALFLGALLLALCVAVTGAVVALVRFLFGIIIPS